MPETQTTTSEKICEGFKKNVLSRPIGRDRRDRARAYMGLIREGWEQGRFRIQDIDLEQFTHTLLKSDPDNFGYAYRHIENGRVFNDASLQEDVGGAIAASQYADFISSCAPMGTLELCGSPDVAPILSMFNRIDAPCANRDLWTLPGEMDIDIDCVTEDEETPSYGLGDLARLSLPEPDEVRFQMKLKRNMVCVDPNGSFQQLLRDYGARVLERRQAKKMIRQMFNCFCPGTNPYSVAWNGTQYDNYLNNTGPWCNRYWNTGDISCCLYEPILAIEEMAQDQVNPLTGFPMECGGPRNVMTTSERMQRYLRELLSPHLKRCADDGDTCTVHRDFPQGQREGWGEVMFNKWVRFYLRECYCELYGSGTTLDLSEVDIDQMLDRTFVAGDFRQAFAWQVRWEDQTLERSGFDTEDYWREDIVFAIRFSINASEVTLRPWASFLVQGIPDSVTPPADCTENVLVCS